jgi:hypothetical protein
MNNSPCSIGQAILGLAGLSERHTDQRRCLRALAFAAAKEELGGSIHSEIIEFRANTIYTELLQKVSLPETEKSFNNVIPLFSNNES